MNLDTGELVPGAFNRILAGRSVSRGRGKGAAVCLFGTKRQFFKARISSADVEPEVLRFREALSAARSQLNDLVTDSDAGIGQTGIFETHLLFLEDSSLIGKIESLISGQKLNSEWAVSQTIEEYSAKYKSLSDKHIREKYIDLEDVGERIIAALGGRRDAKFEFNENTVVVAKAINPSTLIEIASLKPAAIVTEDGGWTSHAFILARELSIPAVTGIPKLLRRTENGDTLIVDGYTGEITVNPSADRIAEFERKGRWAGRPNAGGPSKASPVVLTLDGVPVRISANLDLSRPRAELKQIKEFGVGLYRSEYLFKSYSGYPSEAEQTARYREILELAGDAGVKIRTFDLGAGDLVGNYQPEKNPALGARGIRLSLREKTQFRSQIRALLRAGAAGKLDIVLPMVSDISEIEQARQLIDEEKAALLKAGNECGNPRLGVMIEVPAAVFIIDEILEKVGFVSLGTNDLVQYLLAVDRDNDTVAEQFRTLHPAVIRALKMLFDAAEAKQSEAIVCGEMAGSPLYVPLLIGLGARHLSMNLGSIERISNIIGGISAGDAREIATLVLGCATADETEALIRKTYSEKWPHLNEFTEYTAFTDDEPPAAAADNDLSK